MSRVPANFVEARHEGVEGTAVLPESYLALNPGWKPVDGSVVVPSLSDGKVDDVLASVGTDPALAAAALEAELASSKPRTTLVDRLSDIANPTS